MKKITYEEVEKVFENEDTEWSGDNALQGLFIISEYVDIKKRDILIYAEHDQIWSISVDEAIDSGMTLEDFNELRLLNWMIDEGDLSVFI